MTKAPTPTTQAAAACLILKMNNKCEIAKKREFSFFVQRA